MRPLHMIALGYSAVWCLCVASFAAQNVAPRPLIVEKVNENQLVALRGNTPPVAQARNDAGRVSPNLRMSDLVLVLRRSPEQQGAFEAFVASQYDSGSTNFHHWLEPAEVGEKFGPALADIAIISNWLQGHGLSVDGVSQDRMTIRFSGTAAQLEEAFHTEIHNLAVKGEKHISNMSDPQIPMALEPAVVGPKALHNFLPRPMHRVGGKAQLNKETGNWERVADSSVSGTSPRSNTVTLRPQFGVTGGTTPNTYQIEDVSPYDFATIYNVLPLWTASTPIDGTGQTIAIAGTSDVRTTDVAAFRSTFGLPAGPTLQTIITNGTDPGYCGANTNTTCTTIDDQIENGLDVEWSGAVAPNAQIVLVVSGANSTTTDTVAASAQYVIDHKTAPVLNVSYGLCELGLGTAGNSAYNTMWSSAAAEGIAVFVSSGDSGSPACDQGGDSSGTPYEAQFGLSVSGLASTQYNTAVGGTDLNWGSTALPYWNASNSTSNGSDAKGYMPEIPWNDTCTNPLTLSYLQSWATALKNANFNATSPTDADSACNFIATWWQTIYQGTSPAQDISWLLDTVGAGGGKSNCTTSNGSTASSCSGGYSTPSWQTGVSGIPSDGKRYLPDVSFFASNGLLGSAYLICVSDSDTCVARSSTTVSGEIGGTSASSPAMAGVMALINQKAGSPQGSPNAELYHLAATQNYANCSTENGTISNGCYFNDIDTGTIEMACDPTVSPNCNKGVSSDTVGILAGYNAGVGYDLATGLGSLNVANVVNGWTAAVGTATATVTVSPASSSIATNKSLSVTVTVAGASGTPTGSVVLAGAGYTSTAQALASGSASITIPANSMTAGSVTLTANYGGDSTYAAASGTAGVTVTPAPTPTETVTPASNSIVSNQSLNVTVAVSGTSGAPTGTVTLSSGTYISAATALTSGSATITIPANSLAAGTDTLTATYSGDSTYGTATATAMETVTQAALLTASVSVSASPSSFSSGQGTAVTVTVSGSGGTPTGTIVLTSGSFTSASHTLSAGTTTFNLSPGVLAVGTDTITASYAGDGTYSTATGTTQVTVTQATYTLAATTPAAINRGSQASSTVAVSTSNGYTGSVTVACALTSSPSGATNLPTCTVTGSPVALSSGAATGNATVTVSTTAATAAMQKPRISGWAEGSGAVLALLFFLGMPARRRGWRSALRLVVLMLTMGAFTACGGGGGSSSGGGGSTGTTSGSYTFTVTGTGNPALTPAPTATFTVKVN